jgi:hypothetical protein
MTRWSSGELQAFIAAEMDSAWEMRRWVVTIRGIRGGERSYAVVTAFGRDKAVALAALAHGNQERIEERIYEVDARDTGEVEVDAANVYVLADDDLTDRSEW